MSRPLPASPLTTQRPPRQVTTRGCRCSASAPSAEPPVPEVTPGPAEASPPLAWDWASPGEGQAEAIELQDVGIPSSFQPDTEEETAEAQGTATAPAAEAPPQSGRRPHRPHHLQARQSHLNLRHRLPGPSRAGAELRTYRFRPNSKQSNPRRNRSHGSSGSSWTMSRARRA